MAKPSPIQPSPCFTKPHRCLQITLPTSDLACLNRTHLIDPTLGRLELANGTNLIASIARDTDVVVALKDKLDVADLEGLAATCFGALACGVDDLVDEFVCDAENGLCLC